MFDAEYRRQEKDLFDMEQRLPRVRIATADAVALCQEARVSNRGRGGGGGGGAQIYCCTQHEMVELRARNKAAQEEFDAQCGMFNMVNGRSCPACGRWLMRRVRPG